MLFENQEELGLLYTKLSFPKPLVNLATKLNIIPVKLNFREFGIKV